MTDKPDVAALVEWLQTWSPVTENGQRAHLAASELTRLAAENRTYAEAHAYNSARFAEMLSERDAAKAEIARLRALLEPFAERSPILDVITRVSNKLILESIEAAALAPNTSNYWKAHEDGCRNLLDEILAALKPYTGEWP